MLAFLFLAARHGFVVESYKDNAFGVMEKNERASSPFPELLFAQELSFQHRGRLLRRNWKPSITKRITTATSPTPSSARWWWRRRLEKRAREIKRQPTAKMHAYEVRPRRDKRGFDLISDVLPFGRLWYAEPNAIGNAIGY
jgi:hypothetical protein